MRLLFYLSKLYSIPVVLPLFREAGRRKIPHAVLASDKVRRALAEGPDPPAVVNTLREASAFKPDFVLCPGNFVDWRLPGLKVELFHGIGVEKPSHYRIRHFFDIYLTSGPAVTKRFESLRRKHGYFAVFETGWPKMDHIVNYDATGLRERMGVSPGENVILYAPTHSRSMESAGEIIPALPAIMKPGEVWFCKPHEFMNRGLLEKLVEHNVHLVNNYDITPLLHLADVLVSDTSSVIYEFMALDKPVVTLRTLDNTEKGIDVTSPNELREAIDRSLDRPEEFSRQRRKHISSVNPTIDGSISRTIIDLLSSIDPGVPPGNGRKPLNLFRKMQILYHSRFRKGYMR